MQTTGLDESQAGIKIARRNSNNLRYADDTTLMAETKEDEPLDEGARGEWRSWLEIQHWKKKSTSASLTTLKPLTVWITKKMWKILKEMEIPDYLTCLLRNLSISNSENRTWTNKLVQNWKRNAQVSILSFCLFNLYAVYIMQKAHLDESQVGINIPRRNISNLKYAW